MTETTHDFRSDILREVSHRPWPMPRRPWIMTQTWHDLLLAHWRIDAAALRERVPAQLDLDLFDGSAWLGIVAFEMTNVAPRGVPALPWLSAFPEINVRTYVRAGGRAGVYFLSLDAGNALAAAAARIAFHLPYHAASMRVEREGGFVRYRSRRRSGGAVFEAQYAPEGEPALPDAGSLACFLAERYCLFTVDRGGRARRVDIHHPPWPLQPARAEIRENTMAETCGLALPSEKPLLHYAKRQDVVNWYLTGP
jgi:uncharacterized protein YqjF (DUF2071 family)